MKGLYFYKLESPYAEDITKFCKLTVSEIDNNFIVLKDAVVNNSKEIEKSSLIKISKFYVKDGQLMIELENGESFSVDTSNFKDDFSIDYDMQNGVVNINHNGNTTTIDGLITKENVFNVKQSVTINTDDTLIGSNQNVPLGIKSVEKTGYFGSLNGIIDKTSGQALPNYNQLKKGDRFLTLEYFNPYGYLYTYDSAIRMAMDAGNGWRLPSKDDWDDMLNAIEPCDEDKNHNGTSCNISYGRLAGKLLKANVEVNCNNESNCSCSDLITNVFDEPTLKCENNGVDAYSMGILLAGYGDGCSRVDYFGTRAKYWTSTITQLNDVYTKRFDYDSSKVAQMSDNPKSLCSVRLVKDYDGSNFNGVEMINSVSYKTVLMPSKTSKTGYVIWMATNAEFRQQYNPTLSGGEFLTKTKAYYINEWDGFEWIKKIVLEGDSFTIKDNSSELKYDEFRLVNGELINTKLIIKKEISDYYDIIIKDIQKELEAKDKKINSLGVLVTTEANDRVDDDAKIKEEINGSINELKLNVENSLASLSTQINENNNSNRILSDKIVELESANKKNTSNLSEEIENRKASEAQLRNELLNEIRNESNSSSSGYTYIWSALNEEISNRTNADIELNQKINKEIEDRTNSIDLINTTLNETKDKLIVEIDERKNETNNLSETLNNEISRSLSKDEEIFGKLIKNGSYDNKTGKLILSTENSNDIIISFDSDYGTF